MSSIIQILRRIGGLKAAPTSGSAGQLALWKAGTAATDATSIYAHDGTQWTEVLDTSAQWTVNGADVYRAAGRVGIGVPNPQERLHINGGGVIAQGATVATFLSPVDASNVALVGTTTNSDFVVYSNNREVARFAASGNIGVGLATAPDSDIHMAKLGRADVKLHDTTNAHQILNVGTSQARGGHYLMGQDVYPLKIGTNNIDRVYIDGTTGHVGIATPTPAHALHVDGNFMVSGAGGANVFIKDTLNVGNAAYSAVTGQDKNGATQWLVGKGGAGTYLELSNYISGGELRIKQEGAGEIHLSTNNAVRSSIFGDGRVMFHTVQNNLAGIIFHPGGEAWWNKSTDGTALAFRYNAAYVGGIAMTATATTYGTSSDYRLKENLKPVSNAIVRLNALNPVNFAWKVNGERVDGFIAHEVQAVIPEAVTGMKDAVDADGNPVYQGIDQSKLVPLLTAALQEAIKRIEALEARP